MEQNVKLYWSLVYQTDVKTGEVTAFYLQCPEATAQGRTKEEAKALLLEILPFALEDRKEEFLKYHKDAVIQDEPVWA